MNTGIMQFISSGGFYGAERVVLELAAHLQTQGWRSHLAVLESPGARAVLDQAEALSLHGILIPRARGVTGSTLGLLRDLVQQHRIDVVHSHGYKSDIYQLAAALPGRVARMSTCHSWYSDSSKLKAYETANKVALRLFDHVAVVSPQILQEVRQAGVPTNQSSLVVNGLDLLPSPRGLIGEDLRRELGILDGEFMLLRVGGWIGPRAMICCSRQGRGCS